MLWRKSARDIAKVGVEGSNPFARSNYFNDLVPLTTWLAAPGQHIDSAR